MSRYMRMVTHNMNEKVPEGKAALFLDDCGGVGSRTGEPFGFSGAEPALFPETQAAAIMYAWGYMKQERGWEKVANPAAIPPEVVQWWDGDGSALRDDYVFHEEAP